MFQPTVSEPNEVIYQAMDYLEQEPHAQLGAEQKMCFLFLTGASLKDGCIKIKELAQKLNCSPKETERYIEQLQDIGAITLTRNEGKVYFMQNLALA